MKSRELENLGIPRGHAMQQAKALAARAADAGLSKEAMRDLLAATVADPQSHLSHPIAAALAKAMLESSQARDTWIPRKDPAPHRIWGEGLEPEAVAQLQRACDLPIAVAGALMPDAHVGYGLPIGGVLATLNAVVPYAVGVDIACRMRLSILDLDPEALDTEHGRGRLSGAIGMETRFGIGASFAQPRQHDVLDDDWSISPITHRNKDKARSQLGSSGSGNHFVEFGTLTITDEDVARRTGGGAPAEAQSGFGSGWNFDLAPGRYLALLSHSGSRGTGAAVCEHYSKLAMAAHPELPKELLQLAWLDMDTQPGQEYWNAMELMGRYAAANHECIHRHIIRNLGAEAIGMVENHHNFAWRERHQLADGAERDLIVHRKGATPAGKNILGVIPGSMASPGFVVRGKGSAPSLLSASHGAGRAMSRTKAKQTFAWGNVKRDLAQKNVHVISAGLDEVPGVYKDIHAVMAQQQDLVDVIGRFDPRLVKMAPEGERPED